MTEAPLAVEAVTMVAEVQQIDARDAAAELAKIITHEAERARETQTLNLSKETVLRILELFSKRECLTDEERKLIREMIHDLSNELKTSKFAQAGIHLAFALVGGAVGMASGHPELGQMIQGLGGFGEKCLDAEQVWMEVGKNLRMNDMSHQDAIDQKIHKGMDRLQEAIQAQDAAIQRARTSR